MNLYYINRHLITPAQERVGIEAMKRVAPEDAEYSCISWGTVNPKKCFDTEKVHARLLSIYLKDSDALVVSDHPLIFHQAIEMFGRAGMFDRVNKGSKEEPLYEPTQLAIRYKDS